MLARNLNRAVVVMVLLLVNACQKVELKPQSYTLPPGVIFYGDHYGNTLRNMEKTPDGGYVLGGYIKGSSANEAQGFIQKIDKKGNTEWLHTYGGAYLDTFNTVHQTSDGGYIAVGATTSFGNGFDRSDYFSDGYIVKTDAKGNLLWQAAFGDISNDVLNDIAETPDHGFVATGQILALNPQDGQYEARVYIVRIDENGNKLWSKNTFLTDYKSSGQSVAIGPNGEIAVGAIVVKSFYVSDQRSYYPALCYLNPNGTFINPKITYDNWGLLRYLSHLKIISTSGGFVFAANYGDGTVKLFKINQTGSVVWDKNLSGLGYAWMNDLSENGNGGYIVSGLTVDAEYIINCMLINTDQYGDILSEQQFPVKNLSSWAASVVQDGNTWVWGINFQPYNAIRQGYYGILFTDQNGKIIENKN